MMLKKLIILSLATLPIISQAQTFTFNKSGENTKIKNPQPSIGTVYYDFTYISDTTEPDAKSEQVMALDFSKYFGRFYSSTYKISDSLFKADLERQFKEQQGSTNLSFTSNAPLTGTPDIFLTELTTNKVSLLKTLARNTYIVSGSKDAIDWDIQDSTKQIGIYTCQKAIGTSKGRIYIAWFTTDLPYSFGPRRLFGLPGLILEAYDTTNRIAYHFKSYEANTGIQLGYPENAITSTSKEFSEMQKAFQANPSAFFKSAMPTSTTTTGGTVTTKITSVSFNKSETTNGAKKFRKKVLNFPIDLTEE